jgi:hypothetical protein
MSPTCGDMRPRIGVVFHGIQENSSPILAHSLEPPHVVGCEGRCTSCISLTDPPGGQHD